MAKCATSATRSGRRRLAGAMVDPSAPLPARGRSDRASGDAVYVVILPQTKRREAEALRQRIVAELGPQSPITLSAVEITEPRQSGAGSCRPQCARRVAMNGFLHYFLSVLDPMSNLGFSRAVIELMSSELPSWWLFSSFRSSPCMLPSHRLLARLPREPGFDTPAAAGAPGAKTAFGFGGDRRA